MIVVVAIIALAVVTASSYIDIPGVTKVFHRPPDVGIGTRCAKGDVEACRDLCKALAEVSPDLDRCAVVSPAPGAEGGHGPRIELRPRRRPPASSGSSSGSPVPPSSPSSPAPPTSGSPGGNGPPGPSPAPSPSPAPDPAPTPSPDPTPSPGGSPGGTVGRTIDRVRTTVCPHLPPGLHRNPVCP